MFLLLYVSLSHAPQFKSGIVEPKHDVDISQVTYFHSARLNGLYVRDAQGEIIQAGFPTDTPTGTLFAGCVSSRSEIPAHVPMKSVDGDNEPFTQTKYFLKYDSRVPNDCSMFALYGNFTGPWSAVLGKKESFSVAELLSFPVYSAKLHGSWWNDMYVYHWTFLGACLLAGILWYTMRRSLLPEALFLANAVDRVIHAWTPVIIVDIIPILARACPILWPIFCVGTSIVVGVLSSIWMCIALLALTWFAPILARPLACLLCVGSGYIVAPIALFIRDLWELLANDAHDT